MNEARKNTVILLAEDDPDDILLTKEALRSCGIENELRVVTDGEQLLEYLRHQRQFKKLGRSPKPGLILLDLNMPKKDGREALKEIKSDPELKEIPVVVLTTSKQEEDVVRCYRLGVNSYVSKPVTFEELVNTLSIVAKYWFETVHLPN